MVADPIPLSASAPMIFWVALWLVLWFVLWKLVLVVVLALAVKIWPVVGRGRVQFHFAMNLYGVRDDLYLKGV